MRVGIEVGGTFTDLIALDGDEVRVTKVPSVPRSPEEGVFAALAAADIPLVAHHGPRAWLDGGDQRRARAQGRPHRVRHHRGLPRPAADPAPGPAQDLHAVLSEAGGRSSSARDVIEIEERMLRRRSVATPLDPAAAAATLERGAVGAAVQGGGDLPPQCVRQSRARAGGCRDSSARNSPSCMSAAPPRSAASSASTSAPRTTALSAYVQPIIDSYLGRFEERARARRIHRALQHHAIQRRPPARELRFAATRSPRCSPAPRPASSGAIRQAGASGYRNLVTFDMGGTSTDVCLVSDGKPIIAPETAVDGLPIRTPVVDIASVGAGGGSIVWRDGGGMLRVGPRSSGADPGPACYGRGGTAPTITDAHVIRGTIRPQSFLGGRMRLDADAARARVRAAGGGARHDRSSRSPTARSALPTPTSCARSSSSRPSSAAIRAITCWCRSAAPGPLHAGRIAEDFGIETIVVPQNAGVLSAFGLLASDYSQIRHRHAQDPARRRRAGCGADDASRRCATISMRGCAPRACTGALAYAYTLQMRFVGQAFEVEVPLDGASSTALTRRRCWRACSTRRNRRVYMQGGGSRADVAQDRDRRLSRRRHCRRAVRAAAPLRGARRPRRAHGADPREPRRCASCTVLTTRPRFARRGVAAGPLARSRTTPRRSTFRRGGTPPRTPPAT